MTKTTAVLFGQVLVAALLTLLSGLYANASIISATGADDDDGVVTCSATWDDVDTLSIDGTHNLWDSGHVLGTFTTDTEQDPTVKILTSIDNDTDHPWLDYHIKISMDKSFTISNAGVSWITNGGDPIPGDWTTSGGTVSYVGSEWVGEIDFAAGTPVSVGGTLDFGYKVTFLGTAHYCQEMTPTPEPATLALLALGGLGVLARRKRT